MITELSVGTTAKNMPSVTVVTTSSGGMEPTHGQSQPSSVLPVPLTGKEPIPVFTEHTPQEAQQQEKQLSQLGKHHSRKKKLTYTGSIMKGMIVIWSGAIENIPSGWGLCDGTQGTPDLRNRFVVGAGDTYNPSDTGGTTTHNHTFTGDGHTHNVAGGNDIGAGNDYSDVTAEGNVTGTTYNSPNSPLYHALAYIMKL